MRLYLTGVVTLTGRAGRLDESSLPGRQGRLALAYLALSRQHPVPRSELVEAVWGGEPPPAADSALAAVVSRLRRWLAGSGETGPDAITTTGGCFVLRLPVGSWVDVEEALRQVDLAEGAQRRGDDEAAWAAAAVAHAVARRPFLPAEDSPWVRARRVELTETALRALDCLSVVWARRGNPALAVRSAREAVALAPYREEGWRLLMRAHEAAGNRAEALRAYAELQERLRDDLGVDPSPATQQLHLELLQP